MHFKKFLVTATLLAIFQCALGATETDMTRLRRDLLNGYDKHSRPVQNHKNTTVVRLDIMLWGFELMEDRSLLNVYAWTVLDWEDQHLKWDPGMYGNLSTVTFASHELWQPDIMVYNNLDKSEIDHFGSTGIVVHSPGMASWVPPTKFQVSCQTNVRKWPYDTQKCKIVLGSWTQDGSAVDIQLSPNTTSMDTDFMNKNREWDLIDNSVYKRVMIYNCCPDTPYVTIDIFMTFARKSASHTACVVVPGPVIATAILTAFWLPPGSSERLSITLVAIIINVFYLRGIYATIPNNGDSVPLVVLFYRDSLIMLALSLIWTVCLRYLAATKRNSPVPLPSIVQSFLNSIPAKILCLDPRPSTGGPKDESLDNIENSDTAALTNKNPYQEDWAWLAHLLDRIAFVIYLVVYLIFYFGLL